MQHGSPNAKDLGIHEGDGLCDGVDLDDVALMLENTGYDVLGNSEVNSRYCTEDGALGGLAMEKNLSVTESNSHVENALEVLFPLQLFSHLPIFMKFLFAVVKIY